MDKPCLNIKLVHMMKIQSLMKSLLTHISLSVVGFNPCIISCLLSLLTIQIPSFPFPSSSAVSLWSAPPPPAPLFPRLTHCVYPFILFPLPLLCILPSFTSFIPLPSLPVSHCVPCIFLITLPSIHEDLKAGCGAGE